MPDQAAQTAAVVLAAGKSTRMNSALPKVLHPVCGRPMLAYVLDACRQAGVDRIVLVVGHDKQAILDEFGDDPDLLFVEQAEQRGTGHAVLMAQTALSDVSGPVLVIAGDMPLVRAGTLSDLLATHQCERAEASLATTVLADPSGYGRIIRGPSGEFLGIVEDRDCTDDQRLTLEVNPSYYCFNRSALFTALAEVRPNNVKNEYYLTDVFAILRKEGRRIVADTSVPAADAIGINSRAELAEVSRLMQQRIQEAVMADGVSIVAPLQTWLEWGAVIGADTVIHPFTFIGAGAAIGRGCTIGPFACIQRGGRVKDRETLAVGAVVGSNDGPSVGGKLRIALASPHGEG
jgi:bifunctional UDP-N-acetylglucosamine pyrophosphorylase/glucosamine-1-phosphate N-acetyltransferase